VSLSNSSSSTLRMLVEKEEVLGGSISRKNWVLSSFIWKISSSSIERLYFGDTSGASGSGFFVKNEDFAVE